MVNRNTLDCSIYCNSFFEGVLVYDHFDDRADVESVAATVVCRDLALKNKTRYSSNLLVHGKIRKKM